jgi:hypothetical protein
MSRKLPLEFLVVETQRAGQEDVRQALAMTLTVDGSAAAAPSPGLTEPTRRTAKSIKPVQQTPRAQPGIWVQLLTAGSAACVADLFTFPLDTAKVRLQVVRIN